MGWTKHSPNSRVVYYRYSGHDQQAYSDKIQPCHCGEPGTGYVSWDDKFEGPGHVYSNWQYTCDACAEPLFNFKLLDLSVVNG